MLDFIHLFYTNVLKTHHMLGSVLGITNKMKNKKDKYEAYDLGREMIRDDHEQKGVR